MLTEAGGEQAAIVTSPTSSPRVSSLLEENSSSSSSPAMVASSDCKSSTESTAPVATLARLISSSSSDQYVSLSVTLEITSQSQSAMTIAQVFNQRFKWTPRLWWSQVVIIVLEDQLRFTINGILEAVPF